MSDIGSFVRNDKYNAALEEINSDPKAYTRVFMKIFSKLCPVCKRKVLRKFRSHQMLEWGEYCQACREMSEEEYGCLK